MTYKRILIASLVHFEFVLNVFGCIISLNTDLGYLQPLVLKPRMHLNSINNNYQPFYLPSRGDKITLNRKEIVRISCPGSKVEIEKTSTGKNNKEAVCNKSGKFDIDSKSVSFSSITCSSPPTHSARYTNKTCLNKYREIEIGFELSDSEFLREILICFDEKEYNTLFAMFTLTKEIRGSQSRFPRPNWSQGQFYHDTDVNNLYSRATQRKTINSLLGLPSESYKYVARSGDLFLTRGHLSAKGDFLYGSQQRATFYFINAVPQWQTFNNLNWGRLEKNVRDYATLNKKDLVVYTGTYDVTTLKHERTGKDIKLYLSVNGYDKKIPIPRLIWKLVYEPSSKSAVVLIGVNNPYKTEEDLKKEIICTDISNQIKWVSWFERKTKNRSKNRRNLQNGYGYCCGYNQFKNVVGNVPDLKVTHLLV